MFNQEYHGHRTGIETNCVCQIFYHHGAGKSFECFYKSQIRVIHLFLLKGLNDYIFWYQHLIAVFNYVHGNIEITICFYSA